MMGSIQSSNLILLCINLNQVLSAKPRLSEQLWSYSVIVILLPSVQGIIHIVSTYVCVPGGKKCQFCHGYNNGWPSTFGNKPLVDLSMEILIISIAGKNSIDSKKSIRNPFQLTIPFVYPLKTSKNQAFSNVFRGFQKQNIGLE